MSAMKRHLEDLTNGLERHEVDAALGKSPRFIVTITGTMQEPEWDTPLICFDVRIGDITFELAEWLNAEGELEAVDSHIDCLQSDTMIEIREALALVGSASEWDLNQERLLAELRRLTVEHFSTTPEGQ